MAYDDQSSSRTSRNVDSSERVQCPQPVIIMDEDTTNNVDESASKEVEKSFAGGSYHFSSPQDPNPDNSVYENGEKFTVAMLNQATSHDMDLTEKVPKPSDRVVPKPNFRSPIASRIPIPEDLTPEEWTTYPADERNLIAQFYDMTVAEFEGEYLPTKEQTGVVSSEGAEVEEET